MLTEIDKSQTVGAMPWACPVCVSGLDKALNCHGCGFSGYQKDGMVYLHRSDVSWDACTKERDGWIARTKEIGLYGENEDLFYLPDGRPHLKEFYAESKAHIDAFMRAENLNDKICVDLGAMSGWVEAYMLRTYPRAKLIALEVNDDLVIGLGKAPVIAKRHGVHFISLVADMHHIPLKSNSVDIVYSVDALHHFRDLDIVFAEIDRVLKPGGRFYGINEPDRPEGTDEDEYVAADAHAAIEIKHGIIERRPTFAEWAAAGSSLNLRSINDEFGIKQHVDTASLLLRGEKATAAKQQAIA